MLVDGDHPLHWVNPSVPPLADIGNFSIALGDIAKSLTAIEEQAARIKHLVAFGGDHGVTLPLLRALAKRRGPPALIHLDAHVDTWPENFGQSNAHGSVFYHAITERMVDPRRMVQIGLRSPVERAVRDWTLAQGVVMIAAQDVHEQGPAAIAGRIRQVIGEAPVYLSFDIDALDPAFAPGTGTPEIGGLASWQAQAIMRGLRGLQFVGMDLVEVCPAYDVAEITALAGATIAWGHFPLPYRRPGKLDALPRAEGWIAVCIAANRHLPVARARARVNVTRRRRRVSTLTERTTRQGAVPSFCHKPLATRATHRLPGPRLL
jgi:agmatinase